MRNILLGAVLALVSTAAMAQGTPMGDAKTGLADFKKYGCYSCHGIVGQGTSRDGPRIDAPAIGFQAVLAQLRMPRYEMPAYTPVEISDQGVADIFAYLSTLPKPPDPKTIQALQ
jgi:ubiquinol-cytochrome c reductase cytochrome c subunit